MDVYSVSNVTSAYDTAGTQASIDESYDMFLTLLTTQLENQNPTDPMDTNQITEQFLNYSSIEQQVYTNDMLSNMLALTEELQNGTPTDYLGNEVTYIGGAAVLEEGSANWSYGTSEGADKVEITVEDEDGNAVYTKTIDSPEAGMNDFSWDGIGDDGTQYESGNFTLTVEETTGEETVDVNTIQTTGIVDKVDWSSGTYFLTINGEQIQSGLVTAVATAN